MDIEIDVRRLGQGLMDHCGTAMVLHQWSIAALNSLFGRQLIPQSVAVTLLP